MATIGASGTIEGYHISRPPFFNGSDYGYWKIRMTIYLQQLEFDIWDIIEHGYQAPTIIENGVTSTKNRKDWNEEEKRSFTLNAKAMNILFCALDKNEFNRISTCKTAQSIWKTLEVTHEGTSKVKDTKLNLLRHEYELFMMKPNETIKDMYTRFTDIVNGMNSLGDIINDETLVKKILRILPKSWAPKVTAIQEAKDLSKVSIEELLGSLMTYEMTQLNDEEIDSKKGKTIALKSTMKDDTDDSEKDSDDEIAQIAKKVSRLLKKKNFRRRSRTDDQKEESSKKDIICYECKKQGHIKPDCPNLKKYKRDKRKKGKQAMKATTWDASEDSDSESSSGNEVANLCLMAREDSDNEVSSSSSTSSTSKLSYDELLHACNELQNELDILGKKYKDLKRKFSTISNENSSLKNDNNSLKTQISSMPSVESQEILTKKVEELTSALAKFTQGKENLDKILATQRFGFDKTGLGYKACQGQKFYRNYFVKASHNSSSFITCYHCGGKGHYACDCVLKKNLLVGPKKVLVPKNYKFNDQCCITSIWIPKSTYANIIGPKKVWVPKTRN